MIERFQPPCRLSVARDGIEALAYLRKEAPYASAGTPDLILLDLNIPRKDGREVLKEAKEDARLRGIPIIVLTTSNAPADISRCYDLHANCYVRKPFNLDAFKILMAEIESFWLHGVLLP